MTLHLTPFSAAVLRQALAIYVNAHLTTFNEADQSKILTLLADLRALPVRKA